MVQTKAGFSGLRVLSLESRRAEEIGKLIRTYGGSPTVAPSMREVPLNDNREALAFASSLLEKRIDMLILLTGGGTRLLLRVVESSGHLAPFLAALRELPLVARGPKPVVALGEVGLRPTLTVPEPNTWRELLQALDSRADELPVKDRTVAVQEYGSSNQELLDGLAERGARVVRVPIYDWQLPEDVEPLRAAVRNLAAGETDVVLFTTSVQVRHLMQIARELNMEDEVRAACARTVIGSIGPVTSEELRRHHFSVDLEPSHPKMGFLVKEIAEQSAALRERKQQDD